MSKQINGSGHPTDQRSVESFAVRLEDKKLALTYFDRKSDLYESRVNRGILRFARLRERNAVLRFAELNNADKSVIDVGCGAGFYSLVAKDAGMNVTSVDASEKMLKPLKGRVDEILVADVEQLTLSRTFDRVVCAGVLDFVVDPELAFRNLCKLVSPTGLLVVLAPTAGLGGLIYRCEKWCTGVRVNLFRRRWFEESAAKVGVETVGYCRPLPTNQVILFRRTATSRASEQLD